jgi:pyruvate, water dikinase
VVGAAGAKNTLTTGRIVTVSCSEGEIGRVYDGQLPFETTRIETGEVRRPHIAIMLNLGNPELAFRTAMLPNDGVGLARMEFIVSEHIGVHPMALVNPEKVTSARAQKTIRERGGGRGFYKDPPKCRALWRSNFSANKNFI